MGKKKKHSSSSTPISDILSPLSCNTSSSSSTSGSDDNGSEPQNHDLRMSSPIKVDEKQMQLVYSLGDFPTEIDMIQLLNIILALIKNKDKSMLQKTLEANFYKVEIVPRRGCNDTHYSKLNIVNMVDKFGNSPLIEACKVSSEMAQLLLEYGADPNHRTLNRMECALGIAALREDRDLVKTLVWSGANVAAAVIILTEDLCSGGGHQSDSFFPVKSLRVLVNGEVLARCVDPIDTAFSITKRISNIASFREEYKMDCNEIVTDVDNFAVDFLDQCEKMWEARQMLSYRSRTIKKALGTNKKRFIAHPFTQLILKEEWYGCLSYRNRSLRLQLYVKYFMSPILVPLYGLIAMFNYVNSNSTKYSRYKSHLDLLFTPFMCFVTDAINYIILLLLLIIVCFQGPQISPGIVEVILWLCVLSRIIIEIEQLLIQGSRQFFSSFWNWTDCFVCTALACNAIYHVTILCLILYSDKVLTIGNETLEIKEFIYSTSRDYKITKWKGLVLTNEIGNVLIGTHMMYIMDIYAVTEMVLFLRWINLLDITETLGPLQLAIKQMLKDISRFIIFLVTCLIAFSVAVHTITHTILEIEGTKLNAFNKTEINPELYIPNELNGFGNTVTSLFWSVFGLIEIPELKIFDGIAIKDHEHKITEVIVEILFGIYVLLAVVMMLNMLIAMLNNTYQAIQDNCDTEWKFARAKLNQEYKNGQPFLFPFMFITYPLVVMHRKYMKEKQLKIQKKKASFHMELEEGKQRDKLIFILSERYFRTKCALSYNHK